MSRKLPIRIVKSAAKAIKEAEDWWVKNRDKAPHVFQEELNRALELISFEPNIGSQARNAKLSGVRRLHLARVHYYLYYRVTDSPPTVQVLAFWHTSRGSEPTV